MPHVYTPPRPSLAPLPFTRAQIFSAMIEPFFCGAATSAASAAAASPPDEPPGESPRGVPTDKPARAAIASASWEA